MDLRVKKTKRLIRNTFLELAQKKPIEKITIRELAEKAEISKPTFYAHYDTIYDLLDELEDEVINNISGNMDGFERLYLEPEEFLKKFSEAYYSHPFVGILWSDTLEANFLKKIAGFLNNKIERQELLQQDYSCNIEIIALFIFNGILGCMGRMKKEEFDKAIESMGKFISSGIGVTKLG